MSLNDLKKPSLEIKYILKKCDDFPKGSAIRKRWANSVSSRNQENYQKVNKMCLLEDSRRIVPRPKTVKGETQKERNQWNINFRYCKEFDNGDQCDTDALKTTAVWLGFNFPSVQFFMGNFDNPLKLSFENE